MKLWDNFLNKWKEWIVAAQKFSATQWETILMVCGLITGGGLISAVFGWVTVIVVPVWVVFVAYVFKRKYKE